MHAEKKSEAHLLALSGWVIVLTVVMLSPPLIAAVLNPACLVLLSLNSPEEYRPPALSPVKTKHFVVNPVPGLYESIPAEPMIGHGNWSFGTVGREKSYVTNILYEIEADGRRSSLMGSVKRNLSRDNTHLEFAGAGLKSELGNLTDLPSFIDYPGTKPLVPGRGIPLQTFATLMQMRIAHVPYGGLRSASSNPISNVATALNLYTSEPILEWMRLNPGTAPPTTLIEEMFLTTPTGRYMYTVLTQSGHRITNLSITGVELVPLKQLLPRGSLGAQMLKNMDLNPNDANEVELSSYPDGERVVVSPETQVPANMIVSFDLVPW